METENLRLLAQTPAHLRALISGADIYTRKFGLRLADGVAEYMVSPEVSPKFLEQLKVSNSTDPWTHGFALVHLKEQIVIGMCGFKGPPGADRVAELAYGIAPDYAGRGYATEAARALALYAFNQDGVDVVVAHTLPQKNASTRVLEKCGFRWIGEVVDPEDGLVWKWEIRRTDFSPGLRPPGR